MGGRALYNNRGTAEQWIKEGKEAVKMTRFSCHRFRVSEVQLAQSLLAYNRGNFSETGAATTNRKLVVDESATTDSKDRGDW